MAVLSFGLSFWRLHIFFQGLVVKRNLSTQSHIWKGLHYYMKFLYPNLSGLSGCFPFTLKYLSISILSCLISSLSFSGLLFLLSLAFSLRCQGKIHNAHTLVVNLCFITKKKREREVHSMLHLFVSPLWFSGRHSEVSAELICLSKSIFENPGGGKQCRHRLSLSDHSDAE